jgi:hypothetical protein
MQAGNVYITASAEMPTIVAYLDLSESRNFTGGLDTRDIDAYFAGHFRQHTILQA